MPTSPLVRAREHARDALVQQNVGLVHFLARRLHATLADHADLDELVSAGLVGLLRAAETFDAERGLAFSTYATARIRGAMLDELRRLDPVSRTLRARARRLQQEAIQLAQQLGRSPHPHEIARRSGISLREYWRLEQDLLATKHVALDGDADDIREPASLSERVPTPEFDLDVEIDREREREWIRELVDCLPQLERRVVTLSFFEERSLQEIAPIVGVTESGVSRIRSRAIARLRTLAAAHTRLSQAA